MRRLACLPLLALLAACHTPVVRLSSHFRTGEQRVYDVRVSGTTLDVDRGRRERTELAGRSVLDVRSIRGDETTVRLTFTVRSFTREGRRERHPEQRADLVIGPDGGVRRITDVGGLPAGQIGASVDQLAAAISMPLPTKQLDVGERWSDPLPPSEGTGGVGGTQAGRVRALRIVDGYDCAIVSLTTRRTLSRTRTDEGRSFGLMGTETASTEVAFAFREGLPVRTTTGSESVFDLSGAGALPQRLIVQTTTTLTLRSRSNG